MAAADQPADLRVWLPPTPVTRAQTNLAPPYNDKLVIAISVCRAALGLELWILLVDKPVDRSSLGQSSLAKFPSLRSIYGGYGRLAQKSLVRSPTRRRGETLVIQSSA
ncbi:hypothetical protein HPP92_013635 [Vanilla planifolia]|uniref:Uncharacterized protein n=1 Tax=Vanilla planifolia TaxID=51239 RepID=A0A835QPL0_VANPL|nr:hypothetical protein HPP92_014072 [Vanilla planifolia]KAG0478916.1 hypothetical protein HPP92_013635 [Vanilla planifolia]